MGSPGADVLSRLESAIASWQERAAAAQDRLWEQLARVEGRLRTPQGDGPGAEACAGADAVSEADACADAVYMLGAEAAALHHALESARGGKDAEPAAQTRLRELEDACAASRRRAGALTQRLHELEDLLQAERRRADLLEEQLRGQSSEPAEPSLAPQLTQALRDREEAHEEIVSLRAEVTLLRRVNACLSVPGNGRAAECAGVEEAEVFDADGRRERLGPLLMKLGLVTGEQLETALAEQAAAPHRRLGAILVERGFITEETIAKVLARQLDLPYVRLAAGVVDPAAARLISGQLARRRMCIPVAATAGRVVLAVANPFDLLAIEDVEMAARRRVDLAVAAPSDIAAAIGRHYGLA